MVRNRHFFILPKEMMRKWGDAISVEMRDESRDLDQQLDNIETLTESQQEIVMKRLMTFLRTSFEDIVKTMGEKKTDKLFGAGPHRDECFAFLMTLDPDSLGFDIDQMLFFSPSNTTLVDEGCDPEEQRQVLEMVRTVMRKGETDAKTAMLGIMETLQSGEGQA